MTIEIKDIIKNKAIIENALSFSKLMPQRLGQDKKKKKAPDISSGYPVKTGAELLDNGNIVFRMVAKGATSVVVKIRNVLGTDNYSIHLSDRGDGVFEGILQYDPHYVGPKNVDFFVDDVLVIHPYVPIGFSGNRPNNYIEIPDPGIAETLLLKDVPHGTIHREIYISETLEDWERCMVYTPPQYEEGGEYPVLYLQGGAGENETNWIYNGKLPYILDNLLAEEKCVPFVVVMNDGMLKLPSEALVIDSFDAITSIITKDCRKFIERKYRVKTDKWNRAIAGLSLGSMQASYIGFNHPDLYGSVGLLSGFMRRRDNHPTYDENPHLNLLKNNEKFLQEYRLFFRCMGTFDGHYNEFLEDDEFCSNYGVDKHPGYVRNSYFEKYHDWSAWRRGIYDLAMALFK